MYDDLVNAIRAEIPPATETIHAKATAIKTSPERQKLTLSNGEEVSARLVVLANGLNVGLRHTLGIERQIVSACHSISLGFDMVPIGRAAFDFPALTYFSERPSDRIAYLTLFPVGTTMRANLFTYRETDDPWLRQMRRAPEETLNASLPRLPKLTGNFKIAGEIKIRPADLYVSTGYRQAGIVWSATPLQPPAPLPGPAPTRCSPTSHNSATSTSRSGFRATAWPRTRSRRSMTIRSRRNAMPGRPRRPTASAR